MTNLTNPVSRDTETLRIGVGTRDLKRSTVSSLGRGLSLTEDTNLILLRLLLGLRWQSHGWAQNGVAPGGMLIFELDGGEKQFTASRDCSFWSEKSLVPRPALGMGRVGGKQSSAGKEKERFHGATYSLGTLPHCLAAPHPRQEQRQEGGPVVSIYFQARTLMKELALTGQTRLKQVDFMLCTYF